MAVGVQTVARTEPRTASFATPKIALGSWAFSFGPYESHAWTFQRFQDYSAENGYEGVEINGFRPHPHDEDYSAAGAAAVAESLRTSGLGISGYAPDLRSTPPGQAARADYLDRIESIARFCQAASIDTVRLDTISPPAGPKGDPAEARRRLVSTWRETASLLHDSGIQLVWEFEPGFWLNTPDDVLDIIHSVDHPNFGILFDTSHAHTIASYGARQQGIPQLLVGGAAEFASLLAPWVKHLHLIDSDGSLHDEDTSVHLPFGTGEVDFVGVLDSLGHAAARLPWWTVDYCFWPFTERDAATAPATVGSMRDAFLSRLQTGPRP